MRTMAIAPDKSGFIATPQGSALGVAHASPWSKVGARPRARGYEVEVAWTVGPMDYMYLRAFHRLTASGSLPFLVDLPAGSAAPGEHVARFVPGSFRLSGISGETHTVTAVLEAHPTAADDPDADAALIAALLSEA